MHEDANREGSEPLAQVQSLGREISLAISAIEKNDLAGLVLHVAQQERICDQLDRGRGAAAMAPRGGAQDAGRAAAGTEWRKALNELARLNRIYAAVLERAQKTNTLMANIHRAHGLYTPKAGPAAKHQTWSCEV